MVLASMDLATGIREIQMDAKSKHPKQLLRRIVRSWSDNSAQTQMQHLCVFQEVAIAIVRLVQQTAAHQKVMAWAVHEQHGRVAFFHQQQQRQNQRQQPQLPEKPLLSVTHTCLQTMSTLIFAATKEIASLVKPESGLLPYMVSQKNLKSVSHQDDSKSIDSSV